MTVLFDIERWNDPDIDEHLIDVLFSIKKELLELLAPILPELDSIDAITVIVFRKHDGGFMPLFNDEILIQKCAELTKNVVFGTHVKMIKAALKN